MTKNSRRIEDMLKLEGLGACAPKINFYRIIGLPKILHFESSIKSELLSLTNYQPIIHWGGEIYGEFSLYLEE